MKKLIFVVLAGITTKTFSMELTPATQEGITMAYFGYTVGLTPVLWPALPSFFTGPFASKRNKGPTLCATAGFITGVAVLGCAAYGADQLLTQHSTTYKETKESIKQSASSAFSLIMQTHD